MWLNVCFKIAGSSGKVKVKKHGEQTAKVVAEDAKYNYITPIEHVWVKSNFILQVACQSIF